MIEISPILRLRLLNNNKYYIVISENSINANTYDHIAIPTYLLQNNIGNLQYTLPSPLTIMISSHKEFTQNCILNSYCFTCFGRKYMDILERCPGSMLGSWW